MISCIRTAFFFRAFWLMDAIKHPPKWSRVDKQQMTKIITSVEISCVKKIEIGQENRGFFVRNFMCVRERALGKKIPLFFTSCFPWGPVNLTLIPSCWYHVSRQLFCSRPAVSIFFPHLGKKKKRPACNNNSREKEKSTGNQYSPCLVSNKTWNKLRSYTTITFWFWLNSRGGNWSNRARLDFSRKSVCNQHKNTTKKTVAWFLTKINPTHAIGQKRGSKKCEPRNS